MEKLNMFDISGKHDTERMAKARALVKMKPETLILIKENKLKKGNVFICAQLAGFTAAKKTSELIPFCHPVPINWIDINITAVSADTLEVTALVTGISKTGFEMEAFTAATVASLTIYDMIKSTDHEVEITSVRLIEKSGGKSGHYIRGEAARAHKKPAGPASAAVMTISDSSFGGKRKDLSGPALKEELEKEGVTVSYTKIVPDNEETIINELNRLSGKYDFIFLTGGTGVSHKDITPEAVKKVIEKEIPGIGELLRQRSGAKTPFSFISRSLGGIKNNSIIICLPGSPSGARDGVKFLFPHILHMIPMIKGEGHG